MKIDRNVPIPEAYGPGSPKYSEFRSMSVGDSVFVAGESSTGKVATAARVYGHRSGKKFSSRYSHDEQGVRIWRIA